MGRPSRNSRSSNTSSAKATATSSAPNPPTRTSKRKAAPSPAPSPRGGNAKQIKVTTDDDVMDDLPPPLPLPLPQEEEEEEEEIQEDPQATEMRQRAIELLRSAEDLPSAYAALKLVKENCSGDSVGAGNNIAKRISKLSAADQELIHQASLAVPYLMYKLCVEEFTQPRAQGGLAYSRAKAVEVASIIFEKAGPACCCAANITELQLVKKCCSSSPGGKNNNNSTFTKNDARKVLPILKKIGIEARSKMDETIAKLEAPPQLDETKVVASEEEPQEAPPQPSNETKVTSEGKPQQEVPQADETKVVDDEGAQQQYDL